jgi:hypothetical protein
VADAGSGLQVIDVSNPASPAILGSSNPLGYATGVAVSGKTAYLASGLYGLQAIDVTNLGSPVRLGYVDTGGEALNLVVQDQLIYLVSNGAGFTASGLKNWTMSIHPAQCEIPTPVRLSSFVAEANPRGILLEWSTSSETDFSGFNLHRSVQADGGYERLTTELIRPGANYRFLDSEVTPAITYYYRLEALDLLLLEQRTDGAAHHGRQPPAPAAVQRSRIDLP